MTAHDDREGARQRQLWIRAETGADGGQRVRGPSLGPWSCWCPPEPESVRLVALEPSSAGEKSDLARALARCGDSHLVETTHALEIFAMRSVPIRLGL